MAVPYDVSAPLPLSSRDRHLPAACCLLPSGSHTPRLSSFHLPLALQSALWYKPFTTCRSYRKAEIAQGRWEVCIPEPQPPTLNPGTDYLRGDNEKTPSTLLDS